MHASRLRKRWHVRARRPAADVVADLDESVRALLTARIEDAEPEGRALGAGRMLSIRGEGLVLAISILPHERGDPFRRTATGGRRVDLTLVLSTSQRDTDIAVAATLPAPSLAERAYQHYWEHRGSWQVTLGAGALLLGAVSWTAAIAVGSGLLVAGVFGGPEDDLRPDADDPAATVTPAQLFRIVCTDITRLVDETNLVGVVGPRD